MCQILEAKTPWDNAVRGRVFMVTWHGVYFQVLLAVCLSSLVRHLGGSSTPFQIRLFSCFKRSSEVTELYVMCLL